MTNPIRELPLDQFARTHKLLQTLPSANYHVCHVERPSQLIQVSGYLKYIRAREHNKFVFFRGQDQLFQRLPPSLYRGGMRTDNDFVRGHRNKRLDQFLQQIHKANTLYTLDEHVREPVLQHYGLRTRWLDVVDNIWVALWFACHNVITTGRHNEYMHFEKRSVSASKPESNYAYILLIETAAKPIEKNRGCYMDQNSATIDLRIAAPSHFIRPHAQHGLVMQVRGKKNKPLPDFSSALVGILQVDLYNALEWIGEGKLLGVHSLFPPPTYDSGYKLILEKITKHDDVFGAIHLIGA